MNEEVEKKLSVLCDERNVLKVFPSWPERKMELLRELAARSREMMQMRDSLDVGSSAWMVRNSMIDEVEWVVKSLVKVQAGVDFYGRTQIEDAKKFR